MSKGFQSKNVLQQERSNTATMNQRASTSSRPNGFMSGGMLQHAQIMQMQSNLGNRKVSQFLSHIRGATATTSHAPANVQSGPVMQRLEDEEKEAIKSKRSQFTQGNVSEMLHTIEKWQTSNDLARKAFAKKGMGADDLGDWLKVQVNFRKFQELMGDDYADDNSLVNAAQKLEDVVKDEDQPEAQPVAQELLNLIKNPQIKTDFTYQDEEYTKDVTLKIVAGKGIPGEFQSPFEQGMKLEDFLEASSVSATILWDPEAIFPYFVTNANDADKPESDVGRKKRLTQETMESWVVLAHELGHCQDFLNDPPKYLHALTHLGAPEIEKWNLPREQKIVRATGKTPRSFYQDFVGGVNDIPKE